MDNLNRQMLPFDHTLHVHQAGTVRSDNVFGSGSHVVFHLITPHANGYRLLFYGKHTAKPATFVYMAGLENFDNSLGAEIKSSRTPWQLLWMLTLCGKRAGIFVGLSTSWINSQIS